LDPFPGRLCPRQAVSRHSSLEHFKWEESGRRLITRRNLIAPSKCEGGGESGEKVNKKIVTTVLDGKGMQAGSAGNTERRVEGIRLVIVLKLGIYLLETLE